MNTNMNVEEFRRRDHDFLNNTIHRLMNQDEDIMKLQTVHNIKIVKLDAIKMKELIKNSP